MGGSVPLVFGFFIKKGPYGYTTQKIWIPTCPIFDQTDEGQESVATCSRKALEAALEPGDILMVDGTSRISMAIKYITQSTWSHAALVIGKKDQQPNREQILIEADVSEGVRKIPLGRYCHMQHADMPSTRTGFRRIQQIIDFMASKIGFQYDLKNIFDLARYLVQTPPVPPKHRRRLLALGSGDPTKAICSSLIAQAFQSVNYPILPSVEIDETSSRAAIKSQEEIFHIRHHSLFTPRDFDVSPYFQIVNPSNVLIYNSSRFSSIVGMSSETVG
ncbi:MAG: YiiX/YebB-like N1pC/P60 family cysteine hydrolase [Balneolaceae bacterium]|nr:YiiX/YebB-like N1pC/P60 family cysteine hydrolase [Balneolaceae bacterium]